MYWLGLVTASGIAIGDHCAQAPSNVSKVQDLGFKVETAKSPAIEPNGDQPSLMPRVLHLLTTTKGTISP